MQYLSVVDNFFPDRPSGAGRVAYDTACLMRDRGHVVTLFCRRQSPRAPDVSEEEGIRVVRFDYPAVGSLDPFKLQKQIAAGTAAARRYLAGQKWDIVHLHLAPHGRMVINALGPDQNYIYTAHSPIVDEQIANWADQGIPGKIKRMLGTGTLRRLEEGVLRQVRRIQTLSRFTAGILNERYGIGHKITVIPHWCRPDFFRQHEKSEARRLLGWPLEGCILLSVRRLAPRMGLDNAIEAVAPLVGRDPEVFLMIVGEGPLKTRFQKQVQSLGASGKIRLLGRVSDEVLRLCYEAADLFVLPTRALECFGLPVLESLAFGLPLITTDAAAIPELMNPILPECVVAAGNVDALRQKIRMYLEGKLSLPGSSELVQYVSGRFSLSTVTEQLSQFLET